MFARAGWCIKGGAGRITQLWLANQRPYATPLAPARVVHTVSTCVLGVIYLTPRLITFYPLASFACDSDCEQWICIVCLSFWTCIGLFFVWKLMKHLRVLLWNFLLCNHFLAELCNRCQVGNITSVTYAIPARMTCSSNLNDNSFGLWCYFWIRNFQLMNHLQQNDLNYCPRCNISRHRDRFK